MSVMWSDGGGRGGVMCDDGSQWRNGRYHDDKLEESVAEVLLHRSQKKSGAEALI